MPLRDFLHGMALSIGGRRRVFRIQVAFELPNGAAGAEVMYAHGWSEARPVWYGLARTGTWRFRRVTAATLVDMSTGLLLSMLGACDESDD